MQTNKTIGIPRTNFKTVGTGLASHIRTDKDNFLSLDFGFILDELLKLKECPTIKPSVESFTFPIFSYSFKVFHDNSICTIDNSFAYIMVNPSHVTFLFARDFSEQSLCRLCAFSLKFFPEIIMLDNPSFMTFENLPVRTDSKLVYAEVNTNCRTTNCAGIDLSSKRNIDEHLVFNKNKVSSLISPIKILPIINWDVNRNNTSFFLGGKTDFISEECECPPVKSYRNRLKNGFFTFEFFSRQISFKPFRNSIYSKLRFKLKQFSNIVVNNIMQVILCLAFMFKGFVSRILARFKITIKQFKKLDFLRDFQLNCSTAFHKVKELNGLYKPYGCLMEVRQFLPQLKQWVSLPKIL